jgi:ABC-type branched-subunit amino acid transport system substrate-binding protein
MLSMPLWLLLFAALPPQEPIRIGVVAVDKPDSGDLHFLRAGRLAVDACNGKGGVLGSPVELVVEAAATPADAAAAVGRLDGAGVVAVIAPPETRLGEVVRRAAQSKMPCAGFAPQPPAIARTLDALLSKTFRVQQIAFVRDASKDAHELGKLLAKGGLSAPTEVLYELELGISAKALAKKLDAERPELLVIDGEPEPVAAFLADALGKEPMIVVLTPRALGAAVLRTGREVFAIAGQSMATVAGPAGIRAEFEKAHGTPGFGAAEGFEAVTLVLHAIENAKARERPAIRKALEGLTVEGARGRVAFDKTTGALDPPLAVWRAAGGKLLPYVPVAVDASGQATTAGGSQAGPDSKLGAPFGTFRTRQFAVEPNAQCVYCLWADDGAFATAGADLVQLGLSTDGSSPVVDHLVREEIMARVLAITSGKYGRQEDGGTTPGKSLRICFVTCGPDRDKKKGHVWQARFGGDHPDAGGEAFGTYCRVYTAFIRKTIFQKNALQPPLAAADLELLDGTYKFGTDLEKDKRSEKVRALINSYAGSMGLTLAHETGHLCGLDHVTDDPHEIMNVDEGAGIDYRDGHFAQYCWGKLVKKLGLVGDKH